MSTAKPIDQSPDFVRPKRSVAPTQLFINGSFRPAKSGETRPTFDPATEEAITTYAYGAVEDLEDAVGSARRAFDTGPWRTMSGRDRGRALLRVAELVEKSADELAYLEAVDMGMLYRDSKKYFVPFVAGLFAYYAGLADKLDGAVRIATDDRLVYTMREPLGVVGAISPFNFPLVLSVYKIAPALASGCTVVHKPASTTPLSAHKLAQIIAEADLPPGVFNLVTGPGSAIGSTMSKHPNIQKVSVTGSTGTGIQIIKDGADTLKHVTTELGGKSANIVFADADLDISIPAILSGAFGNKGEQCFGGTRLLVERSAYDAIVARLVEATGKLRVGDALDPGTDVGPIAEASEYKKILRYIDIGAKEDKARIAIGGGTRTGANGKGFFIEPTLMVDAKNSMRIAQEEIFGPVLTVIPFDGVDDAIALANGTPFGLAAGVNTRDMKKAMRVARGLQAGSVWINTYGEFDPAVPFGGYKSSGIGRELGTEVLENYMQTKSVWLHAV